MCTWKCVSTSGWNTSKIYELLLDTRQRYVAFHWLTSVLLFAKPDFFGGKKSKVSMGKCEKKKIIERGIKDNFHVGR